METSKQREVVITGFGGQGIILTGNILGKAATIGDGRHATMTQSYGPEARGGSCSTQVIVSDGEIAFPYAEHPQLLVCMSQEGYEKNQEALVPGGTIVWDTDLVETGELNPDWRAYHVPATRLAEELGNKMMANIVMLGFVSAVSDVVGVDSLKEAMLSSVPPHTKANNDAAFERGREYGQAILKSRAKRESSGEPSGS
ncbi:MAG: 2-oxoacid:acceptor oxidoreductase family protein [Desulfarculaceae bacterium]|nr:2-oxoacid:acceptor oxidoreductase family protein [Desulfarculaceae bacterium]MCF8071721.1 2-oxoacid:acceptor oxidoreductase family protein [Desulfarculaceae bacterium]MCF8102432.1 2-oxoacid:acceptor oxidoreductase family protein [Desulfarculaceae bacterium]MCF8116774.1 2-oxoacid:acceptor oxidoreductase family protein [Desulfarculaceae bacterium]